MSSINRREDMKEKKPSAYGVGPDEPKRSQLQFVGSNPTPLTLAIGSPAESWVRLVNEVN